MSDDAARHGIVNAIHRGILGGFTNLCSCGASIIEPDGGHESTDAHLAGPPSPPRKPRTYRQGYADGKAWQAAQPVVVTAEQVSAAALTADGAEWGSPPWVATFLAALGITVEPTP